MKTKTLQELFKTQQNSLSYFFEHLDLQSVEKLVDKVAQTKGIVFLTGVGKSGFIAQKIAATFVSMGIKAMFMPPTNALHGDLGIVDGEDFFIFMSKSGESDELLNLIPFIRNKGATNTVLVSKKNSRLGKAADAEIILPVDKELCPYNMIPTISTEVQLIFGDLLAVALMQKKKLSLDQFAHNHPAGIIGKRLSLKVEDLMLKDDQLPICYPEDKLSDALEVFTEKRCGCLLVINEQKHLIGIFTDGDLRRALQAHGAKILNLTLKELKRPTPQVILPQKMAWEAMQLMEADQKRPFMVLPVVNEGGQLQGLIKMHDILQSGMS